MGDIKSHPLPVGSQVLPLVPSGQVALIGDAAAMIDPLTGEGIHFGIWAGRALGVIVAEGLREGDVQTGLERFATAYAEQFGGSMEAGQRLREILRFQRIW